MTYIYIYIYIYIFIDWYLIANSRGFFKILITFVFDVFYSSGHLLLPSLFHPVFPRPNFRSLLLNPHPLAQLSLHLSRFFLSGEVQFRISFLHLTSKGSKGRLCALYDQLLRRLVCIHPMSQFFFSSNSTHSREILRLVKGCVQILSELIFATGYTRWPLSQKTERDPYLTFVYCVRRYAYVMKSHNTKCAAQRKVLNYFSVCHSIRRRKINGRNFHTFTQAEWDCWNCVVWIRDRWQTSMKFLIHRHQIKGKTWNVTLWEDIIRYRL